MKRELGFASLGNGIVVYDQLHEQHGDYEKVAHISKARVIKYYTNLDNVYISEIEDFAVKEDPSISKTQKNKVFITPPK